MDKSTAQYIYESIKFYFNGQNVVVQQWCRCGVEEYEIETLGM